MTSVASAPSRAILRPPPPSTRGALAADLCAITIGAMLSLCVSGYQFGRGNHHVYLLDALRVVDTQLLSQDWFTSSTLQYHLVFTQMTAALARAGLLEQAFFVGQLLLLATWHIAWLLLTRALGGGRVTYLLSVVLFTASAGGISVGAYQFLQDSCFLPSNVANVALLWAIVLWARNRLRTAGACVGLAGLFHLNHAVVGLGLWYGLNAWELLTHGRSIRATFGRYRLAGLVSGTLLATAPCLLNLGVAMYVKLQQTASLPLDEFVELYVRFRHAHHFDPTSWPVGLWLSFLWPMPFVPAMWLLRFRRARRPASPRRLVRRRIGEVFIVIAAANALALLTAGVWYLHELLVQLHLYRFSIYLKLVSCIAAAWVLWNTRAVPRGVAIGLLWGVAGAIAGVRLWAGLSEASDAGLIETMRRTSLEHTPAVLAAAGLCAAVALYATLRRAVRGRLGAGVHLAATAALLAAAVIGGRRWLGVGIEPPRDDPQYLEVCAWASDPAHTPVDAVFVVPPDESAFRLRAKRAIVVNYKHVPQLAGELPEWRDRLEQVLGLDDLASLPDGYFRAIDAIARRYDARAAGDLAAVARRYDARYLVLREAAGEVPGRVAFRSGGGRYIVIDLGPASDRSAPTH